MLPGHPAWWAPAWSWPVAQRRVRAPAVGDRAETAMTLADRERAGELLARVREPAPSLDASQRERLTGALASPADLEAVLSAN